MRSSPPAVYSRSDTLILMRVIKLSRPVEMAVSVVRPPYLAPPSAKIHPSRPWSVMRAFCFRPRHRRRSGRGIVQKLFLLSLSLMLVRPSLRRQRGDIGRDGSTVSLAEKSSVANDFGHRPAGEIAGRVHAVGQKARDIFFRPGEVVLRPMLQASRCDVGHPAIAVRSASSGESFFFDDRAEKVARAVASTM